MRPVDCEFRCKIHKALFMAPWLGKLWLTDKAEKQKN
jgi:hypothetical protein